MGEQLPSNSEAAEIVPLAQKVLKKAKAVRKSHLIETAQRKNERTTDEWLDCLRRLRRLPLAVERLKLQQADEENALTGKIESAKIVASQKVSQSTRGSFVYDSDDTDMEEAPPLQEESTEGSRTSKSSSSFEDHMMLLQSKQHLLLKSR
jgi:hypothetical protein